MSHPIHSPETFADASLLIQVLRDERIVPRVEANYGPVIVMRTEVNALAWYQHSLDVALPSTASNDPSDYLAPSETDDQGFDLAVTMPPVLMDTLKEPPLSSRTPKEFNIDESKVVLSTMRKISWQSGFRRSANDFLARNAPNPIERVVRKAAVASVVSLIQLKHARITRSRDSPHWAA